LATNEGAFSRAAIILLRSRSGVCREDEDVKNGENKGRRRSRKERRGLYGLAASRPSARSRETLR
jgi:hypothetical protein